MTKHANYFFSIQILYLTHTHTWAKKFTVINVSKPSIILVLSDQLHGKTAMNVVSAKLIECIRALTCYVPVLVIYCNQEISGCKGSFPPTRHATEGVALPQCNDFIHHRFFPNSFVLIISSWIAKQSLVWTGRTTTMMYECLKVVRTDYSKNIAVFGHLIRYWEMDMTDSDSLSLGFSRIFSLSLSRMCVREREYYQIYCTLNWTFVCRTYFSRGRIEILKYSFVYQ